MLSVDKHCELLTSHIRDRNNYILEGFKLFVQMFAALVGGSVVVRLQYSSEVPGSFTLLADALALLILIATAAIIIQNLQAWYGFRERLADVAGKDKHGEQIVPDPRGWKSATVELVMLAVMAISTIAFFIFNPLRH